MQVARSAVGHGKTAGDGATGEGTATTSGAITVRTLNAGTAGVSGLLSFSTGTASSGNRGALWIGLARPLG